MKKSNKQRRAEIKARRLERAAASAARLRLPDVRPRPAFAFAIGCEPADRLVLRKYNNTYGLLPDFYVARPFTCRDCGAEELWTAKQQKWCTDISTAAPCDAWHAAARDASACSMRHRVQTSCASRRIVFARWAR